VNVTGTENADLSTLRINRSARDPGNEARQRRKIIWAAGIVILLGAGYLLLQGNFASARDVELATASLTFPSQANAVLTANGYVVAQQKAAVASKATGRLVYLGVEEGDHVTRGEVIARLEDQDVVAALEKARADLRVALADSVDARRTLDRQRTLITSRLISQADFDAAEANYLKVTASIQSARAAVASAEVAVEYTRIRAPFDGTVLTKDADVGEIVAPFAAAANSRAAVVSIANMSSLQVEADVSESNITRVSAGQPCEIVLDAYPEKRYQGKVHKIVPTADRAKATVLTKVAFDNLDNRVLPDMSVKVMFLSARTDSATAAAPPKLTVPASSVVNRNGTTVVLLVKDSRVVETPVKTGSALGSRTEIMEGLAEGDKVVLRPEPDLTTGTRIKVESK
jgi:RND family efflux transporter MFP subunit